MHALETQLLYNFRQEAEGICVSVNTLACPRRYSTKKRCFHKSVQLKLARLHLPTFAALNGQQALV
eukprot:3706015-Pleurochrysis_carterae.AAC.1